MLYFTGDLHFGDPRILHYTGPDGTDFRPFDTVAQHDEAICDLYQSVVGPDDTVIFAGDIARDADGLAKVATLNGRKTLLMGNYDTLDALDYRKVFEKVTTCLSLREYRFIAAHRPLHPSEFVNPAYTHFLHAHVHAYLLQDPRYICVSLENCGLKPVSIDQIQAYQAAHSQTIFSPPS